MCVVCRLRHASVRVSTCHSQIRQLFYYHDLWPNFSVFNWVTSLASNILLFPAFLSVSAAWSTSMSCCRLCPFPVGAICIPITWRLCVYTGLLLSCFCPAPVLLLFLFCFSPTSVHQHWSAQTFNNNWPKCIFSPLRKLFISMLFCLIFWGVYISYKSLGKWRGRHIFVLAFYILRPHENHKLKFVFPIRNSW